MSTHRRALLFFHHIISKKKRAYIRDRAQDLSVSGICKVGFPGVLIARGTSHELTRYVADVKVRSSRRLLPSLADKASKRLKWQSCTVNVMHDISELNPACFGSCMTECKDMAELKRTMVEVEWLEWWVEAMGFHRKGK